MKLAVSVIIPAFNIADFILKCLESLKDQTLSQDLFEVIVIDDVSTDKTMERVKGFKQLKNLRVLTLSVNGGPGIARNKGVKAAQGEYILFLDGDDRLEPQALEILYQNMQGGVDSIAYNWAYSDDIAKTPRKRDFPYIAPDKADFIQNYLGMSVSGDVIYTTTKREIFEKYNVSFLGGYHEDIAVIFKMLYLSSTIKKLPEDVLYLKNNRPGSIVNTITFKHVDGYLGSWPDIMDFLVKHEGAAALEQYLNYYLRGINGLVYTLIYKTLHTACPDDLAARKKIYSYIFSALQKDKFIKGKKMSDFPKQTKKDIAAHEYYRLVSEDKLSDEIILAFENKFFRTTPVEAIK
ncbi:MAG: hypothetical protein A3D10_01935 [Omnitrophica WOR_2 bacterium RIFCSPHIGHO2_02_FULL_48_11]|nr:MAG: hypothetical protein A3D10_01935 [Omnitrophica WOR_2 bacterium RIFCSPHIGHO2_02_FULL_48_11]